MDVRELYQSTILDHNKRPRNYRVPERTNREARGDNPLCGDKITVHVLVEDGVVKDVGFQGSGCAISRASASLMTDAVKGRTVEEAERAITDHLRTVLKEPVVSASLGDIAAKQQIVNLYFPEKSKQTRMIGGSSAEAAKELVRVLREEARVF